MAQFDTYLIKEVPHRIVHCLQDNVTFCGMINPDQWPSQHWWLSLEDWPVNDQRLLVAKAGGELCSQCDEMAQAVRVLNEERPAVGSRLAESFGEIYKNH